MHEYSLVQALLQRVAEEARARRAVAVRRVTVRIGPLAGVERRLFATAFRLSRADGLCDAAELVIAGDEAAWRCAVCGADLPAGAGTACPTCGMPAVLAGGDELTLERIEMEVPSDV
jgi:hydrogenase nickel incorporation protein HypA/HybF